MARMMNKLVKSNALVDGPGNSGDIRNSQIDNAVGAHFIVKTSNLQGVGSPTVVVIIEGKDEQTGDYYTILSSNSIASATTTVLKVMPGFTASSGTVANDFLPATYRVRWTFSGADSMDVMIGVNLVA